MPPIDETADATTPWEDTPLAMLWNDDNWGGEQPTFPAMLHALLSSERIDGIVSFLPHGRAFKIHDHARFCNEVLPSLDLTRPRGQAGPAMDWETFLDLLRRFGFRRVEAPGPDEGAYYHELFLRGQEHLAKRMTMLPHGTSSSDFDAVPNFSPMPQMGQPTALDGTMSLPSLLVAAFSMPAPRGPFPHLDYLQPPPPPHQDLGMTLAEVLAECYRVAQDFEDESHWIEREWSDGHASNVLAPPMRSAEE